MADNLNTFTLIFCEDLSYFVEYPEERYIRRACFAFAFSNVSIPNLNDVEATLNEEELERHAEFTVVLADIPQRSAIDTVTLVTDNHLVRYASDVNAFLFHRMTHYYNGRWRILKRTNYKTFEFLRSVCKHS